MAAAAESPHLAECPAQTPTTTLGYVRPQTSIPVLPTAVSMGSLVPRAHLDITHEQLGGRLDRSFAVNDLLHSTHPAHSLVEVLRVQAVAMLPAKHCNAPVACEGQTHSLTVHQHPSQAGSAPQGSA